MPIKLSLAGNTFLFNRSEHKSTSSFLFELTGFSNDVFAGLIPFGTKWQRNIVVLFMIMVCFVVAVQCLAGSDVLRWRSFYTTEDYAWKAHYHEVFDHSLREALCCMGRAKYLYNSFLKKLHYSISVVYEVHYAFFLESPCRTVLEEDEVYSVAQLLGDLVAYRASGTGHLELLAGFSLF